jgi:hypothetical protein
MSPGGSLLRRFAEKLAEKTGARRSAGFPWSKGIPDRHFPRPMTGGSGCTSVVLLAAGLTLAFLILIVF